MLPTNTRFRARRTTCISSTGSVGLRRPAPQIVPIPLRHCQFAAQSRRNLTPQTFERLLRNPIYSGWIVIPSWGLREKGSFDPLVSEDTFHRVQEILDGKRLSVTAHQRNNPYFPLRVFARCGNLRYTPHRELVKG